MILDTIWINFGNIFKVRVFGPESQLTKLVPNFTDVSPDDAFSSIPYEKGHMLLYHLEQILGGIGKLILVLFLVWRNKEKF